MGGSVTVDPGALVELQGQDSAIGFESQKAQISEVVEAFHKLIKWAGLPNLV